MKTARKAILLVLCAALLVTASVMGTLAYLTDTDTVNNTFSVGQVGLKLDEAKVDADGKPVDENGNVVTNLAAAERVQENSYHLLPGHEYTKDPTVTIDAGSEDSYVRMMVTVKYKADAENVFGKVDGVEDVANWLNINSDWIVKGLPTTEETTTGEGDDAVNWIARTYEFRYTDTYVSESATETKLPALFTTITVPEGLTNAQIATLEGLTIDAVAHAIQADGFADHDAAWAEFTLPNA